MNEEKRKNPKNKEFFENHNTYRKNCINLYTATDRRRTDEGDLNSGMNEFYQIYIVTYIYYKKLFKTRTFFSYYTYIFRQHFTFVFVCMLFVKLLSTISNLSEGGSPHRISIVSHQFSGYVSVTIQEIAYMSSLDQTISVTLNSLYSLTFRQEQSLKYRLCFENF